MANGVPDVLVVFTLFAVEQAAAYYCDSDKCGENEYCCGFNTCCTSFAVWQMWYFWCGLVFFLFMLSVCAGFCRYRYYQRAIIITSNPYSRLDPTASSQAIYPPQAGTYPSYATAGGNGENMYAFSADHTPQYTPNYPPPPYAQVPSQKSPGIGYSK